MEGSSKTKALIFGFLSAFFWGTHSVIVRYLTTDLSGWAIASLRLYIAAGVLFLIMKIYRRPVSIPLKDKFFLLTVGATVTNYIFFHVGLEKTTASNAMVLENTAPFFVLIFLALFLREPIRRREVIATIIAVAGVFLTVRRDLRIGGEGLQGDLLELLAGMTWAVFLMSSSKALSDTKGTAERLNFLLGVFLLSALLLTPFLFVYPPKPSLASAGLLVLLGIFPTAVAYYLWYEAAARVSTISAALFFTLSVIFTFLNAFLFLGEELTADMLIGGALIVGGVVLSKVGPEEENEGTAEGTH